ncbi:MAG TPA: YihY/virulence factor BrkB family protein [Chitinispirillaceae bacterium]|nr:YihY/virulence factor BrkB family protein [Chitinispirillaceae bacterium]
MKSNNNQQDKEHGRFARRPEEISIKGWWDIAVRVKKQMTEDNISIVAAGVAFYAFLAIFPALTALISMYGLLFEPSTVESQLIQMAGFLPQQAANLVGQIMRQIAGRSEQSLGWGVTLSILLGLWSANNGTKSLVQGLNIAYDEKEKRSVFKLTALTLLLTLSGILVVLLSIGFVIGIPTALNAVRLPKSIELVLSWTRWPVLALLILVSLSIIYKIAPCRNHPKWRWVTWGSTIATILWLTGSIGFSLYVQNFGNYNATYGSIAAVVILLFWFQLSSYIVLFGAEINSEIEHQTMRDTTKGAEKPMGKRGAFPADDLGEAA